MTSYKLVLPAYPAIRYSPVPSALARIAAWWPPGSLCLSPAPTSEHSAFWYRSCRSYQGRNMRPLRGRVISLFTNSTSVRPLQGQECIFFNSAFSLKHSYPANLFCDLFLKIKIHRLFRWHPRLITFSCCRHSVVNYFEFDIVKPDLPGTHQQCAISQI